MRSPFAPLIALLALGLLIFVAARYYPGSIEADVTARAAAELAGAGLETVAVSADGRDVTLTGQVRGELERAQATRIVGQVRGVRRVDNNLAVQVPGSAAGAGVPTASAGGGPPGTGARDGSGEARRGPWRTRFSVSERELVLEGDVPAAAFREQLAETVPERFSGLAVRDSLVVRADGSGDAAGAVLEAALAELPGFAEGEALLTGRRLEVSGRLRSGVDPGPMEERIRGALPEGYSLDFRAAPAASAAEAAKDPDAGSGRAASAEAEGEAGDRPSCQPKLDEALGDSGIVFAFGSAELDPAARALLDRVASVLVDCPEQRVEIGGHTDSAGDADVNQKVSEARALAVVRYLIQTGIAEARLTAVGYGEARPVADNSTPEGRRRNRRIEFRVTH